MFQLKTKYIFPTAKRNTTNLHKNSAKFLTTDYRAYNYKEHGDPRHVLSFSEVRFPEKPNFRVKLAPINPSDINMIEGRYPMLKQSIVKVAGNECVGYYSDNGVQRLAIPRYGNLGTWRKFIHAKESDLIILPDHVRYHPFLSAVSINPLTALRLLRDFASLKRNQYIIQNTANSTVGRCVIQLAKIFGFKTINIVRNRPGISETIDDLKKLGADIVKTDAEIIKMSQTDLIDYPRADLALNAAGGSIVPPMIRFLNSRSTVVTYGSMSKKAILVPASTQIFKQICYKGFWLTSWVRKVGADAKLAAIEELYNYMKRGELKLNLEKIPFDKPEKVIDAIYNPPKDRKTVIAMD